MCDPTQQRHDDADDHRQHEGSEGELQGLQRGPEELRYPFGQVFDQQFHQCARFSRFSSRAVRCESGMLTAR